MAVTDVGVAEGYGVMAASSIVQFNKVAVLPPLITMVAAPKGSLTARIPVYSKVAHTDVTASTTDGAEETTGSAVSITVAQKDCTINRYNAYAQVTDLAAHSNADSLLVNAGRVLGNAVAAKFDNVICNLLDDLNGSTGAATTSFSTVTLFDAVGYLEQNDAPRPYAAVLHPLQVYGTYGLSSDLGSVATEESKGGLNVAGGVSEEFRSTGFAGTIGGVSIYTSPNVVGSSPAASHEGGIFAKTAIGCGFVDFGGGNFIQIETDRNAPAASTEVVANAYFEAIETVGTHGVGVTTQTS